MLKLYLLLCYEFMKIGIFAIGGGYAALPFLYYLQEKYNWFTVDELTNMIAVSNITPGPIGINMATYTGYTTIGISGALISTVSIVLLPFFIVITIIKLFDKFKTCSYTKAVFEGLRPASCALLVSIGLKLLYQAVCSSDTSNLFMNYSFDYKALLLFIILVIPFSFLNKNPLLVIIAGAAGGILFQSI